MESLQLGLSDPVQYNVPEGVMSDPNDPYARTSQDTIDTLSPG